ncbi:hypothetical protein E3T54_11915 [Cryobacterium sp. Sr8]|uniref:antitoxin VbhA family protein n=1 Tax=Cryobacterium sp. Sr8 TaxID=1259203 RepID=UPI00106A1A5F|nr:antitoxin VbhA family protein [Cryobacterium sp. Sr8]TFD75432.1 hypothetical protein E3T54_11915 [Cryobacterium sp. Sr8]
MTPPTHDPKRFLTGDEADARLVEIDKCQQLAGHFPSAEALARARRILIGEMTLDEARAEILAKYSE